MGSQCCKHVPSDDSQDNLMSEGGRSNVDSGTKDFLTKVQLFKRLPPEELPKLAEICVKQDMAQGSVLIKQGDDGHEFFVIVTGKVIVTVDNTKVAELTSGDYFGENALLRNEPRTATITAATNVKVLKITRDKFLGEGLNEKLEFQKRQAVGGAADKPIEKKPPVTKNQQEKQLIFDAIKKNANLTNMMEVTQDKLTQIADVMWTQNVAKDALILKQGDLDADYFYIVKDGSFDIYVEHEEDQTRSADKAIQHDTDKVGTVGKGGSFGELALLYFAPRAATVKATVNSTVFVIDRIQFKNILSKSANDIVQEHRSYLQKVDVLANNLKDDELTEVAKALMETNFSKGETIFEQGETGLQMFILYEGKVSVTKNGKEVAQLSGSKDKTEFFGELALLEKTPRTATIKVLSDTAKTLSLDKTSFDLLLGPLGDLKKRGKAGGESKVGKGRGSVAGQQAMVAEINTKQGRKKIYRKDLARLGLLGCGGFGAVELVEHTTTKDTYALKALSKGYIVKCGMKKGVLNEKNIQMMCDSPFVVKLWETYNGEQSLYFLLELALGGELYATYSKRGFHGSEKHAKFYISGTVYAFDHLHEKKIIFRDLKPENLLLTEKGEIKLTDMGLAKVVVGKTYTTCGTPDYFAPELIASIGHSHAVDWWTLGILTFELMAGHPPFESAAPMQIYSKVTKGINKVSFPQKLKGACEDLVKHLCRKEPSDRLPMKKGGTENIKKHAWFNPPGQAPFDWAAMKALTLEAPYKPKVKSKKDIANFSARKEDMPPQVKYKDDGSGWDADFATST